MEMLFPPLGVACLASQLHALGIEARVFDCTFSTFNLIAEKVCLYQPQIVGIYSMVTMSRSAFQLAERIHTSLPEAILVAGGPLPTLYPGRYAESFDAVFRGEADLSFPRFCLDAFTMDVSRGRLRQLPLDRYPGLFIHQDDLQTDNPMVHYGENEIASFPLPYRDDFDHPAYQGVWHEKNEPATASILTTLGCPSKCDFCSKPVYGDLFRRKDLDRVFEEIEGIQRLGYESLWIADDNFTLDPGFLKEFCNRISGRGISWSCLSRVTGLNRETARLMKESGCRRVYLGLESGNSDTLRLMKKQATLEEGINAVRLFRDAGIETAAFFIVGYPGETVLSIDATFNLAITLPLDYISFNVPFPLPGSPLFDRVSSLDGSKDWNTENEVTFVYNSEFDQEWLRRRIEHAMEVFAQKKKLTVRNAFDKNRRESPVPAAALV
jgi:anaerobic magnesium-protoporphyrin IX monomethyl ester cyclase